MIQAGNIPSPGDFHPNVQGLTCRNVDVDRSNSPIFFNVTASYQSPPRPAGNDDPDLPPWFQPADVEYISQKSTIEVDEDVNGDPIVNPGTDEPVFGVQKRVTDLSIRVTKNLLTWNRNEIYLFVDSTNSDTFLGFPPGTVIIDDINAKTSFHDDITYYVATYIFSVRKPFNVPSSEAWYWRRRLEGFLFVDSDESVVNAVDEAGNRVSTPVLIREADGTKLPNGDPAEFKTTQLYESKSFAGLSLFT